MLGLVGPNGAGKTTTLSMATGLLRPDAGTARVLDQDVWQDPAAAKALIGVLPDGLRLFDRLSGGELLRYVGLLRRVPPEVIASRSADLLEALGLLDDRNTLVVEYSAGMTKKIGLACALIHVPRLLILDDPFEAVDPRWRTMKTRPGPDFSGRDPARVCGVPVVLRGRLRGFERPR